MAEYAIICTVDRLGPNYDGSADVWFGINLSAGITAATDTEALDPNLLKPWLWDVQKLLVSVDGAQATEVELVAIDADAKTAPITRHFDDVFEANKTKTEFFEFAPLTATGQRWPLLLGHLSTSVAPVPHALKLTHFFKLPAGGTEIFAAPVFKAGTTTYTPDKDNAGEEWIYDDATVKAHQPGTPTAAPPSTSMIDLATHWIRAQVQGEEWRSGFEQRIAALFDLGQLLIDIARMAESPLENAHVAEFRGVALRALYDLAGTGATSRPDGQSLVTDIVPKEDAAAITTALLDFEASLTPDMWLDILSKNVANGADHVNALKSGQISEVAATLDALQSALSDDQNLIHVVRAQWAIALTAHPEALARFDQRVPDLRLRDRLALSNLGRFWTKIHTIPQTATNDREALRDNVIAALKGWYDSRTAGVLPDALVRAELEKVAKSAADTALDLSGTQEPSKTAHPVTVQLDRLYDVNDEEDFLRRIAGTGVLMRRKGGMWRCLNMAAVHERKPAQADKPLPGPGQEIVVNAIVPYRLQFVNDVRQAFVSYNNHPIVARSPAEGLRGPLLLKPDRNETATSRLQYEPAPAEDKPELQWNFLPALVFGEKYEVLAFAIGNGGALPKLLAQDAKPIVPVTAKDFGDRLAATTDAFRAEYVRELEYLRRVPIGSPRFSGPTLPKTDVSRLDEGARLPRIPETVVPLARDHGVSRDIALVLLANDDAVSFHVRPPAVDINVWDRWVARDESDAAKKQRKLVWAEVHRSLPSNPNEKPIRDVSLDDPAVEKLRFRLEGETNVVDIALKRDSGDGMASVQALPIGVKCVRGSGATPSIVNQSGTVVITMPHGDFKMLTIEPVLHAGASARFAAANLPALELVVEAVSDRMPSEEELWQALTVKSIGDGKLAVELKKGSDDFRFLKRVEVIRQLWRWDGRPGDPFPFDKITPATDLDTHDDVRRWESIAFADRRDSDALTLAASVNFESFDASKPPRLYTEDRTNDPRAQFFRYAVRVRSRYEGIVNTSVISLHHEDRSVTQWKRGLLRARPDEVKKPKVKLVVPLTEAGDKERTPGLLVVLNEPWFDVGGLAEQLHVEVARAADPAEVPGPLTESFAEVGTDPIVDAKPLPGRGVPSFETVLRPVGFTFDTDTEAPLFVRSSFLIPAPKIDGTLRDLSWVFARVRFRRVIAGKGIEAPDAPDLSSEPTESHWVQFLPDAGRYRVKDANDAKVEALSVVRDGKLFALRHENKNSVLLPTALDGNGSGARLFDLWLLLTQDIVDVVGRQKQEKYVGMYRWNEAGKVVRIDGAVELPDDVGIVVRIIEVQQRPGEPMDVTGNKWWEQLFNKPGDDEHDVRGRIVRISPPIRPI